MSKIPSSEEMHINVLNPPQYDASKHYYDQAKPVREYYGLEKEKITKGVTIGGYYMHPWLYYHLNYFMTPVPQETGEELLTNPPLDDNMFYITESYKQAEKENKGMFVFGTRGAAKTTFISSLIHWLNTIKENGVTSITGSSVDDLNGIAGLIEKSLNNVNPAFNIPRLKTEWEKEVEFGIKLNNGLRLTHSTIKIVNANKGTEKSSEKGAGPSPVGYVIDEAGKFSFKKILESALPSFRTQYGAKLVHILSGTGGNAELSQDAKDVLSDPEAFSLILTNWGLLNRKVPEEAITWGDDKGKKFSVFVPGQMSYRLDVPKIKSNLADYLDSSSQSLKAIGINLTDWNAANKRLEEKSDSLNKEEARLKQRMYFPTNVDDCFLTERTNPFPVAAIIDRIKYLEAIGDNGKAVNLYRESKSGNYKFEFVSKQRAAVKHGGGTADAPILLFDHFPETGPPPRNMFVSGLDGYKLDNSETDSLGSFYILKRRGLSPNEPCETIACSYTARPERLREFHQNCERISDTWNAECLMEGIDMSFKEYLETKNRHYDILSRALSFSKTAQDSKKKKYLTAEFGLYPNVGNNRYRFNLFVDYSLEEHTLGLDDEKNPIIKTGVDFIDDIDLLKEMRDWRPGGNFDRITAFSHALVLAREMDKNNVVPDNRREIKLSEKDIAKKKALLHNNKYGRRLGNKY